MDYEAYAAHFDQMCAINPAYQQLHTLFGQVLDDIDLPDRAQATDLGAGTGNFICTLLERHPDAQATHVDCSPEMNDVADQKYREKGLTVEIVNSHMQIAPIKDCSQDLIVCVNSLNNAPPVKPMLENIYRWLVPGGYLFLVDFGREINVIDWGWYLVKHVFKTYGLVETISEVRRQSKIYSINRSGKSEQRSGTLWTHTTDELLGTVSSVGLTSMHSATCYRGYADLVVAQRPAIENFNEATSLTSAVIAQTR